MKYEWNVNSLSAISFSSGEWYLLQNYRIKKDICIRPSASEPTAVLGVLFCAN